MQKDFYYVVKPTKGNRWVVSDIHGCNLTFQKLIWDKLKLTKNDQLFLLGDYIDRGPDSKGILDTLLYLKKKNYPIFPLKGNHEQDLITYNYEEKRFLEWHLSKNNELNLLNKKGKVKNKYIKFINSLPLYYFTDNYIMVHAGFDTLNYPGSPYRNKAAMTQLRSTTYRSEWFKNKTIICGHTPVPLSYIKDQIFLEKKIINLDNGAVFKRKQKRIIDTTEIGNLCAFNLDTRKLIICPTIDF